MKSSTSRTLILGSLIAVVLASLVLAIIGYCYFMVWPPDIWSGEVDLISELEIDADKSVQVLQTWRNDRDIYEVYLSYIDDDGERMNFVLWRGRKNRWSDSIALERRPQQIWVHHGDEDYDVAYFDLYSKRAYQPDTIRQDLEIKPVPWEIDRPLPEPKTARSIRR